MNLDLFSQPETCHRINIPNANVILYPHLFSNNEANNYFNELYNSVQWSQQVIAMYGKQIKVPRLSAWYGEKNLSYEYSGIREVALPWLAILKEIKNKIEFITNSQFNSVLINLYRDGKDSVDWHSDDEPELGSEPTIASVSFGEQRRFHLKSKSDKNIKESIMLPHGSLLLMSGKTQQHYSHKISKSTRVKQARINLTFRTILT